MENTRGQVMTYEIPMKNGKVDLALMCDDIKWDLECVNGEKALQALVNHTMEMVVERLEKANNIVELLDTIRAMKEEE